MESQHSIECAIAGEVQNSEGVLLDRVILYVYSMVGRVFKLAHAHVGHRRTCFAGLGVSQMICQKSQRL